MRAPSGRDVPSSCPDRLQSQSRYRAKPRASARGFSLVRPHRLGIAGHLLGRQRTWFRQPPHLRGELVEIDGVQVPSVGLPGTCGSMPRRTHCGSLASGIQNRAHVVRSGRNPSCGRRTAHARPASARRNLLALAEELPPCDACLRTTAGLARKVSYRCRRCATRTNPLSRALREECRRRHWCVRMRD